MKQSSAAPIATPSTRGGSTLPKNSEAQLAQGTFQRDVFLRMVITMSWQLALAILIPIIAGVEFGKKLGSETAGTFTGLIVAAIGSILVLWHTVRVANGLPAPKVTAAQKRAIQKQYEAEDKDE